MKKRMNKEVIILAALNLLFCFGVYVSLPVLALYFNIQLDIPIAQVGILLGIPPLITALFGSLGAAAANKFGEVKSLLIGITLIITPYIFYLFTESYFVLIALSVISGIGGICWKPVIRALFAHHSKELKNQNVVFRINYIVICLGAIAGPGLGLLLRDSQMQLNLYISIFTFLCIIIIILLVNSIIKPTNLQLEVKKKPSLQNFKEVDPRLFMYVTAGALVFIVFSQFEGVFPLAFTEISENPAELFALLLIINSIAGIVFQFLVMYIEDRFIKLGNLTSILIGNFAFGAAFVMFALSEGQLLFLIIATLVFALGEVYAVPGSDIMINNIAPDHKKSLYFGIAEFRTIGFSIGPIMGAALIDMWGATILYWVCIIIIGLTSLIYIVPSLPLYSRTKNHTNEVI
ncbi:MFS transporter [Alkalihalophilus marmarensis]|uniref:MFS transporter n=1 Tax=Alkalihalophilus marmarensis TaxID=521377 RepID=UPI002DB784E8|nr:MFS transporter [Alkalihalophilus marmarensis]MEC2071428.1 MFS transporter [Alkalihalophilus marmarensis]